MPFQSEKQRRYIYLQAALGKAWAIKFLHDMGLSPPTRKHNGKTHRSSAK